MLLSAVAHLCVATLGFSFYASELRAGRNRIRWVEYAASSTLLIVLIASVVGIYDAGALLAIAANIAMILFGWLMETVNQSGRPVYWSPFWFGCIAGIAPWKAVTASVWISVAVADDGPPGFVYGILVTIFLAFNCFALNQWLQYRGSSWADYAHGETAYIWLSLIAKSPGLADLGQHPHRIVSGEGRPACSRSPLGPPDHSNSGLVLDEGSDPFEPVGACHRLGDHRRLELTGGLERGVDAVVDHPLRFPERRRGALCEGRGQLDGGGVDIVVGDNPVDQPPGLGLLGGEDPVGEVRSSMRRSPMCRVTKHDDVPSGVTPARV